MHVELEYRSANITVVNTEVWENSKKYTVYKVVVDVGDHFWFVFKRYNEFARLHTAIKKHVSNSSIKLPGKRLFGNNFDPVFIQSRREGLEEFLKKVVEDEKLFSMKEVQLFLHFDSQTSSSSSEDCETENELSGESLTDESSHNDEQQGSYRNKNQQIVDLGPSERIQVVPSNFEFLKVIGKGSFGKVFLAKQKSEERLYAIKVLQKKMILKKKETKHIMAERNVLIKNYHHPFLVSLHYSFQTVDKLYFVLDYINGGELFFHLQRERHFSEPRARFYTAEVASAIGYLHSRGIVYRDLKPENILLKDDGHLVLTDFGLCKEGIRTTDTTTTFCGTPEYLAPEILRKQPYDQSVDWWCLGCVLYEMLHGLPPFYCREVPEMYDHILNKPLQVHKNISEPAQAILKALLHKDKTKRLGSTDGINEVKSHRFFTCIDWDLLVQKKLTPPFIPRVMGSMDIRNIDPEFTREPIPSSVSRDEPQLLNGANHSESFIRESEAAFAGFSYIPSFCDMSM